MKKVILLVLVLAFTVYLIPGVAEAKLVACVGNSNTYGYGLSDRIDNCYPTQLERLLRQFDPHWETRNFGVSGATVLGKGDLPYVTTTAYAEALVSEPDVVILCFGPNGSRSANRGYIQESYVSDYISLIDAFAALPSKPEIWICYPLKAFSTSYTISDAIIRDQIIPLITQIASEKVLPTIDFYTAFEDSPHLCLSDGIHPNPSGTKLMAEIVSAFLTGVRANPDLNGDGIVDSADLCMVVDYWHTNEPSCDIAPPPFGDGIVDVQDLIAIARYLKPSLIARWTLDESEGTVAADSAGSHNATLSGNPVWQPTDGKIDGALAFDGVDDYVNTPFVLNAANGSLSTFAWIKGGGPGQVIVSQTNSTGWGGSWLCADSSNGRLATVLMDPQPALVSESVITDGAWHHIGLVWDKSYRYLYVDGAEVARDATALNYTVPCDGSLYLGVGKTLDAGSFFSGMIDDVRIYNVALNAEKVEALAR